MKIAICFRAEVRTGVEAADNILNFIGDLLPYCDFFIHTWDNSMHRQLCKQPYADLIKSTDNDLSMWSPEVNSEKIQKIQKIYNPKLIKIENYKKLYDEIFAKYGSPHRNYLNQFFIPRFYSWMESVLLKKQYELDVNLTYDYVVSLRFDTIYGNSIKLIDLLNRVPDNGFGVNAVIGANNDIIDDLFFISSSAVMDKASKWQQHRYYHAQVEDYLYNPDWNKLHTPFYHYIKNQGLEIIDLRIPDFCDNVAILRKECLHYDPIGEFNKCRGCDKINYHIWENSNDRHINLLTEAELIRDAKLTLETRKYLPPVFHHLKDKL